MFQRFNHPDTQAQKPAFDVVPPFMNVLMARINHQMSVELQKFIESVDQVEDEIEAFRAALRSPRDCGVFVHRQGPSFIVVSSFKGVVTIEMNDDMRGLLIDFIEDVEGEKDKIIWAFKLGLAFPGMRDAPRGPVAGTRRRVTGPYQNRPNYGGPDHELEGGNTMTQQYGDGDDDGPTPDPLN